MTTRGLRSGMTLLELIVGIVVTGAVAAIGAAAFGSIIDHRRVILTATADVERAAALRDMIRTWIGSGQIAITTGGANRTSRVQINRVQINSTSSVPTVTAATSTGDELTFTTNSLTPSMAPNTRVRLFIDGDDNTPEYGLTIEYQGPSNAPLQRKQLDPAILAMTVEFLDQRTNKWYPYSEAATIRPIAARLFFPQSDAQDAPIVPALLQYPMLFVLQQQAATQQQGGGR